MRYESKEMKLGSFKDYYNIPIYQRLYVWENDQINLLIEDLIAGFNESKDIYLGSIVVVKNKEKDNVYVYDLIDGQQRFTTLWLLMAYLGNEEFYLKDKEPRLIFSIRKQVKSFQKKLINNITNEHWKYQTDPADLNNPADLKRMLNALDIFKSKLSKEFSKEKFSDYLSDHVHLIVTEVPSQANLNKLFELINGRGIQLQQHEILKAKLLHKIEDNYDKMKYGLIWDVCSDMDYYIHSLVKESCSEVDDKKEIRKFTWDSYFNKIGSNLTFENFKLNINFSNDEYKKSEDDSVLSKSNIDCWNSNDGDTKANKEGKEAGKVQSIINFSTLLLYALATYDKVYKHDGGEPEFVDKNLNKIFNKYIEQINDKTKFIEHLFNVRVLFDEYVIKFIDNSENKSVNGLDNIPSIQKIEQVDNNKSVRWSSKGKYWTLLEQLQAMLYHAFSRNTQHWLIPYFRFLLSNPDKPIENNLLTQLMKIENHVYGSFEKNTILERANDVLPDLTINLDCINEHLKTNNGNYHKYGQYWFYKMDWIIYYLYNKVDDNDKKTVLDKDKTSSFVFTARNSIEHIFAQNNATDEEKWIHGFDNLALLSSSRNSEYTDNPITAKKVQFEAYLGKTNRYESLKLAVYFAELGNQTDYEKYSEKHLERCIALVEEYYKPFLQEKG